MTFQVGNGKFYIIDFNLETRLETAVVPDIWVFPFGNYWLCYWPPNQAISHIVGRTVPKPDWKTYPAIFRKQYGDTFSLNY
jgi:hypothetical protein